MVSVFKILSILLKCIPFVFSNKTKFCEPKILLDSVARVHRNVNGWLLGLITFLIPEVFSINNLLVEFIYLLSLNTSVTILDIVSV